MNITKRIKLDFGRSTSPVTVWVKQGDENSRQIEVEPLLNGMAYTIPSGVSARFACRKPDGHQVLNDYPTISGNIITIPLTPQTLAEAGEGLASVILFDNVNQSILSTQNFILRIEENPLVGSEVESSDEYQSFLSVLGNIGSVTKKTLAQGNYYDGNTINLMGTLSEYDLIEIHVKDTYGYTGVLHGRYTDGDYAGGGVTVLGGVRSSGGYIYYASVSISSSGYLYFPAMLYAYVGSSVSWSSASSGSRYVTKIVGYKFNEVKA